MEGYGIKEVISEMFEKAQPAGSHNGLKLVTIPANLLDEAAVMMGIIDPRQLEATVTKQA